MKLQKIELNVDSLYRWYINGQPIKGEANSYIDLENGTLSIERVSNLKNYSTSIKNYYNFKGFNKKKEYRLSYKNGDNIKYSFTAELKAVEQKEVTPFHVVLISFKIIERGIT